MVLQLTTKLVNGYMRYIIKSLGKVMVLWLNLKWRDKWQPLWLFTAHVGKPDMMVQNSESIRANCIWWKVGFSPAPILVYFLWHFSTCHIRIEEIWRTISHAKTTPQHVGSNMLYKILLEKWLHHNYDSAFGIIHGVFVQHSYFFFWLRASDI